MRAPSTDLPDEREIREQLTELRFFTPYPVVWMMEEGLWNCATHDQHRILFLLAYDSRMRRVWRELGEEHELRQEHANERIVAWMQMTDGNEKMIEQAPQTFEDLGLALYYHRACVLALLVDIIPTEDRGIDLADVRRFLQLAHDLTKWGPWGSTSEALNYVIGVLDPKAMPAMQRDRVDQRTRAYVIQLSRAAKRLFGRAMYGTVATTANVALNLTGKDEITSRTVRNLVSHDP